MDTHTYIAIDLKSFYASVECVERKLDPLTTHLVVADKRRTEKTICLAVSPSLKAYGIPGRARLFEVVRKVKEGNAKRQLMAPRHTFTDSSFDDAKLKASPELSLDYITAPPRMGLYVTYSTRIYQIYLQYIAPEDIHVYSIDEVFMDVTGYLKTYKLSPRELAMKMILDVLHTTGITATAGIGTNLYLCKIAMDVQAKHVEADENGVRIAELDEMSYRRNLWNHRPITDFWRVGSGYAKKLEENGLYTMGDIARCSLGKKYEYHNEELLYTLFGVPAELLIDHAWGWEPCTIADVKAYTPSSASVSSGQVLKFPYTFDKTKLVIREMTERLVLDLVDKNRVTDQVVLTVGYDVENIKNQALRESYQGEITTDRYGRTIPKQAHGTANLGRQTSSTRLIMKAVMELCDNILDPALLVRRIHVTANHVVDEKGVIDMHTPEQGDLFTEYAMEDQKRIEEEAALIRERKEQRAMLAIQKKYGKNAILKGIDLQDGATAIERNTQIGGHKA
ncbi:DNA repair protein [Megasphaera sueciensis]|uniref:Y-family DNA polymerase n=1 Tax=Megasphaera sueciensis TaxID=349094 RepID=UPI003D0097A3